MTNLETLTADSFNFDQITQELGKDPFAANSDKFAEDTRFYKLGKDKEGNGGAVIRFLPDINKKFIVSVNKINTTIEKNGKKRFVNELSPTTIGLPCPFQEKWAALWNAGEKEESKKFGRGIRHYANIKVIKDPMNPENEGKIFLLDMSETMKNKIHKLLNPSPADRNLGDTPKELFNPVKGNSFRLVVRKGANGIPDYTSSDAIQEVTSIYNSIEEAFADIRDNTHTLNQFSDPANFLSYEKLQEKLKWVTFAGDAGASTQVQTVQPVQPAVQESELNAAPALSVAEAQPVQQAQPAVQTEQKPQSIDDLLSGLV